MLQSDQKERDVNLDIATQEVFRVPKRYTKPKYTSTSPTVLVNNRFAVLTTDSPLLISDDKYITVSALVHQTETPSALTSSTPAALTGRITPHVGTQHRRRIAILSDSQGKEMNSYLKDNSFFKINI